MSGDAIVMMVIAMVVIWGGLVAALVNLQRSPDLTVEPGHHRDL
jgi:hypothetical protein